MQGLVGQVTAAQAAGGFAAHVEPLAGQAAAFVVTAGIPGNILAEDRAPGAQIAVIDVYGVASIGSAPAQGDMFQAGGVQVTDVDATTEGTPRVVRVVSGQGDINQVDRSASDRQPTAWMGVPVPLVTGDEWLVDQVRSINPNITTVAVKQGIGEATVNIHPNLAVEHIREAAGNALKGDLKKCLVAPPGKFHVEIRFKEHHKTRRAAFYPGGIAIDAFSVGFDTDDYFEVLRFFMFM